MSEICVLRGEICEKAYRPDLNLRIHGAGVANNKIIQLKEHELRNGKQWWNDWMKFENQKRVSSASSNMIQTK